MRRFLMSARVHEGDRQKGKESVCVCVRAVQRDQSEITAERGTMLLFRPNGCRSFTRSLFAIFHGPSPPVRGAQVVYLFLLRFISKVNRNMRQPDTHTARSMYISRAHLLVFARMSVCVCV